MKIDTKLFLAVIVIFLGASFLAYKLNLVAFDFKKSSTTSSAVAQDSTLKAKFDYLSKNGNSSCSQSFRESISQMADNARLQGSCCSPMSWHRYSEQVEGIKKYKDIAEIPPDPYDIDAKLAKKLMSYYDMELSPEEQKAYNFAMANSSEKGPCCCKCWRWYVYGGLGKLLIREKGFSGEQVTEVWDLSDGCGGDSEHHHT